MSLEQPNRYFGSKSLQYAVSTEAMGAVRVTSDNDSSTFTTHVCLTKFDCVDTTTCSGSAGQRTTVFSTLCSD
ncbi:hypothetical protein HDV00_006225 [Rhizophlyctis rosea]|nr:hypothetical protein HDV00_006225 [Rhizophlyctis rosea]